MLKIKLPSEPYFIAYTNEDFQGIRHPHDDALVVSMTITNYNMSCILGHYESSTGILY